MTDPVTVAIAAALAGKAVEVAGDPARNAVAAMARKVRERFRGSPAEEEVLEGVIADPEAPERLAELHEAIRRAIAEDPAFAREMESLRTSAASRDDGVVNVFNGNAEKSVQLRDVQGDLNIS